ncbi:MAG: hypothetical protein K2Q28_06210 [Hyphomicrobium sp.]|nr:hypothetical protein [Hyphomicrobium sp.]
MLLLSLPWLLLALAAWRATNVAGPSDDVGRRDSRGEKTTKDRAIVGSPAGAVEQPGEGKAVGVLAVTASNWDGSHLASHDAAGAEPVFQAEAVAPPTLSPQEQEDALVLAVAAAKAERDDAALSRDSVLLAKLLIARSARSEAAALLQSAALVARRAKLPVVHAQARIELADLARSEGDMTSACEHWQMAKLMFHETGRRVDQDRIADLMRQNRCPTDWILTNF